MQITVVELTKEQSSVLWIMEDAQPRTHEEIDREMRNVFGRQITEAELIEAIKGLADLDMIFVAEREENGQTVWRNEVGYAWGV